MTKIFPRPYSRRVKQYSRRVHPPSHAPRQYTPALRRAPGIQTKVLGHVDQFVFSGLLPYANHHSEDFAIYVLSHMLGMSVFGRAFRPFLMTFVGRNCRRLCVCCHLPLQDRGHHSNSKAFCHDPTVSPQEWIFAYTDSDSWQMLVSLVIHHGRIRKKSP